MSGLVEKLEAAEVGSRELDWLIADATDHPSFARKIEGIWPPFTERSRSDKDVPAYSTSLDAALALAERALPGCEPGVMVEQRFSDGRVQWGAWTSTKEHTDIYGWSPALALCAAILRAKQ